MTAERDALVRTICQEIVQLARDQIGSHYVWGGAGATPGGSDGAHYRPRSVLLHANDPNPQHQTRSDGLRRPMLYAAWCRVAGDKVCAGRSLDTYVSALPRGVYDPQPPACYELYSWPRPDGLINSRSIIWGESCLGIRHFDCIGFVNWCISRYRRVHFSITQYINNTDRVSSFRHAQPCDIVTKAASHIGIATGEGTVVHAKGTKYGVVETNLDASWSRCGRLRRAFWNRLNES